MFSHPSNARVWAIKYDDGDLEMEVPNIRIRPPKTTDIVPTAVAQIARSTNTRRFKVGDQIVMRQDNAWVAGLVETINPNHHAYRVMSKTETESYELTMIKEDTNKFIRQPDGILDHGRPL